MAETEYKYIEPPVYFIESADGELYLDPNGEPWYTYHSQVATLFVAKHLGDGWSAYRVMEDEAPPVPWDRDITDELPYNKGPYSSKTLNDQGGWWQRTPEQIDGLTIHHTLSDSPHATANYIVKQKDVPTTQYQIWVSQTGEVLKCTDLTEGLWHDHTGNKNTHISVGLAGRLHEYTPADVQIDAAVKIAVWAIATFPNIAGIGEVQGHRDWVRIYHDRGYYKEQGTATPWTACPGWASDASGNWRAEFYERLGAALER